jgi:hypothetical protein
MMERFDGTSGQDRESYTDDQDRESYTVSTNDERDDRWAREEDERARAAAQALSHCANLMSHRPQAFVEAMSRVHRTLQQSSMELVLNWIVGLARLEPGWYDARNAESVRLAKVLLAALEADDRTFFDRTGAIRLPTV